MQVPQEVGGTPERNTNWKSAVMGSAKTSAQAFRTLQGIPSGPDALEVSSLDRIFCTSETRK